MPSTPSLDQLVIFAQSLLGVWATGLGVALFARGLQGLALRLQPGWGARVAVQA